jgi:hypothetical protein
MSATASRRTPTALLHDDSGEGLANYSVLLGLFGIQCICGAIALNHHIEDVVRVIQAVFA